jgi:hypothetical protein
VKIGFIACGVLEPHARALMQRLAHHEYVVHLLPAGLHANPGRLRTMVQELIDEWSADPALDGIALGYGLCGRGCAGLFSRQKPLALPRTQDCIGIFLGSHARYLQEFNRRPGTRYMTQGLFEATVLRPGTQDYASARDHSLYGLAEEELVRRYGADNARYIAEFRESWKRNYQRAAYIRFAEETGEPPGQAVTAATASSLGWEFEVVPGDASLLQALLDGQWHDPRILLVPPYSKTVPAPGVEVVGFTTGLDCQAERILERFHQERAAAAPRRSGIGLGIDTGGTFTDAVLWEFDSARILASAKAPTTHANLVVGIRAVLGRLPAELLGRVRRVGLSTTLATNAFVERKGRAVALCVMAPIPVPLEEFPFGFVRRLAGAMSIEGDEVAPLDAEEIARVAREALAAGCEALAVSGFGSVINPAHELEAARIAREAAGLPVVCGHQLTSSLNFVERATTAAMNAKLVPLIEALLEAVQAALREAGLTDVPLFVVKGDGSQMLDRVAREVPVETVLSGPAASVIGALRLFDVRDAVVADMGGTTLDLALVRDGAPRLADSGARVAGFQTSVRAMAVHTVGLGGDSEIDLSRWPRVEIGPRRIIPICRMGADVPDAAQRLDALGAQMLSTEKNGLDFIGLAPGTAPAGPLLSRLAAGPLALQELAYQMLRPAPAYVGWREFEDNGRIRRYGLTLTDLLHVTGQYDAFDAELAHKLLALWAQALGAESDALVRGILLEFRRVLCSEVLQVALPEDWPWNREAALLYPLTAHLADGTPVGAARFHLTLGVPLIGVGAPAPALFPPLGAVFNHDVLLSDHAGVANALGAIAGDVRLLESAEIRVGDDGALLCRWRGGFQRVGSLEQGLRVCEERLTELLRAEASANQVPFQAPQFVAAAQQAQTREGLVFLGLTLTGSLRG